ncbi:hypothetical protein [Sporosarcina sp. Marseille-Q4943]|uniref:hypothetical protein n=1 Tax=Sporosarcina sp. Marseille-Q4943 TaxID=2942204 RepID=UPI00208DA64C|nr:hypothetical protein [Sporosarcina sp. Marseille-Q4943]
MIFVSGGRFPRARLQPIEQRRVRFVVFQGFLQTLRHPASDKDVLVTLRFYSQKPFFATAFAGVAALHFNQQNLNHS